MKKLSKITLRKEDVLSDAEMKHILGGMGDGSTVDRYDKVSVCKGLQKGYSCWVYLHPDAQSTDYKRFDGVCDYTPMAPFHCTNLKIYQG